MSRFVNSKTGVVISVADDKDERFVAPLWSVEAEPKRAAKKSTSTSK